MAHLQAAQVRQKIKGRYYSVLLPPAGRCENLSTVRVLPHKPSPGGIPILIPEPSDSFGRPLWYLNMISGLRYLTQRPSRESWERNVKMYPPSEYPDLYPNGTEYPF